MQLEVMSSNSDSVATTALHLTEDLRARTNGLRRSLAEFSVRGGLSEPQEQALQVTAARRTLQASTSRHASEASVLRSTLDQLDRRVALMNVADVELAADSADTVALALRE